MPDLDHPVVAIGNPWAAPAAFDRQSEIFRTRMLTDAGDAMVRQTAQTFEAAYIYCRVLQNLMQKVAVKQTRR